MLLMNASLMQCGESPSVPFGTIPVPLMIAAALMLRLIACCSGVLPGVAVRLFNGPTSSNSLLIVTPDYVSNIYHFERDIGPASSYFQHQSREARLLDDSQLVSVWLTSVHQLTPAPHPARLFTISPVYKKASVR
jgi:hypothetical protein